MTSAAVSFSKIGKPERLLSLILLCAGLGKACSRAVQIHAYGLPRSFDGFYYLQEITYRLQQGEGYYHKFSLFFSLCSFAARFFSLDPLFVFKAAVWLSLLLLAIALGVIGSSAKAPWNGPALFTLIWFSEPLFFMHYGLLRQAAAGALLAAGLAGVLKGRENRPRLLAASLALILLAAAMHVFVAAVAVLVAVGLSWDKTRAGSRLPYIITGLAAGGACLAFLLSSPKPLLDSFAPHLLLPWREVFPTGSFSARETWQYEIYFWFSLLFLTSCFGRGVRNAAALCVCALYLFMTLPFWSREIGLFWIRFLAASPFCFFLAAALAAGRPGGGYRGLLLPALLLSDLTIAWLVPAHPRFLGPGVGSTGAIMNHRDALREWIPESAFVKAPPGLQYAFTYFTGRRSAREWPRESCYSEYFEVRLSSDENECPAMSVETAERSCFRLTDRLIVVRVQSGSTPQPDE